MRFLKRRLFSNGPYRINHGVVTPHNKVTDASPIRRLAWPDHLYLTVRQHQGAPGTIVCREGQEVRRGDILVKSGEDNLSVPLHSPADGRVESISLWPDTSGHHVETIILKVYDASPQADPLAGQTSIDELMRLPGEELRQRIRQSGLVGLGGAGFPVWAKLGAPSSESSTIDTVLINGAECEPWLTADSRVMQERGQDIVHGIKILMKITGANRARVVIESDKAAAIQSMRQAVSGEAAMEVVVLKSRYPGGAEKVLIEAVTGREVPVGKYPADANIEISNAGTTSEIGRLLVKGHGLLERVITVSGTAREPGNYIIPIGTSLGFIMEHTGIDQAHSVIMGGPMMGKALANTQAPVTKGVTGIIGQANQHWPEEGPCIRCGQCLDACPLHLNPAALGKLALNREFDTMWNKYHLRTCFECGSCSFVCPSHIPLVQRFRAAKNHIRRKMDRERSKQSG